MQEGLLDLLIVGGGYMPYAGRLQTFVDLAHRYGIPAYPCINHFREPVAMRSLASNFWALGADGVYLFNYFGVGSGMEGGRMVPQVSDPAERRKVLSQMGDPASLRGLEKTVPGRQRNFHVLWRIHQPSGAVSREADGSRADRAGGGRRVGECGATAKRAAPENQRRGRGSRRRHRRRGQRRPSSLRQPGAHRGNLLRGPAEEGIPQTGPQQHCRPAGRQFDGPAVLHE